MASRIRTTGLLYVLLAAMPPAWAQTPPPAINPPLDPTETLKPVDPLDESLVPEAASPTAPAALAPPKKPDWRSRTFSSIDTDQDGAISSEELQKVDSTADFVALDVDLNGQLSPHEWERRPPVEAKPG
jgi:hypothetical protein